MRLGTRSLTRQISMSRRTGVELDIELRHELSNHTAIAECKAYSSAIAVPQVAAFYGKLAVRRGSDPNLEGLFIAIPRLTADANLFADKAAGSDARFRTISSRQIWDMLEGRGLMAAPTVDDVETSDPAIVVHADGYFAAALEIDPTSRDASRVLIQAVVATCRTVKEALTNHPFALGRPVVDPRSVTSHAASARIPYQRR